MRKPLILLTTVLLLQACSVLNLVPSPSPANTSTPSPTTSNTPTITLTPTRTTTPTPRNTATLIISEHDTPVILVSEVAAATDVIFNGTPLAPTGGFVSVELSVGSIFYGVCKPNYTKMTIQVDHPEAVTKVYIFFRLESGKKPGDTTKWYGSITDNDGGGYFRYTLRANNIPERKNFLRAWVNYQFVAEDAEGEIIGRSQIFTRTLTLAPCR
jgi:hypothetical protein